MYGQYTYQKILHAYIDTVINTDNSICMSYSKLHTYTRKHYGSTTLKNENDIMMT